MLLTVKKYWLLILALVLTVIKVIASILNYHRLNNEIFDLNIYNMYSGILRFNPIVAGFFLVLLLLFAYQRITKVEVISLSKQVRLNLTLLAYINLLLVFLDSMQIFGYIAS